MRRYLLAAALSALLAVPVAGQAASPSASTSQSSVSPRTGATQAKSGLIDINSASAQELDKLPGIGQKRAEAIISNRPYKSKDELAERKIVPEKVYAQIKDRIVARQSATTGSGSSEPRPSTRTPSK